MAAGGLPVCTGCEALHRSLHDLSQPLTVLLFAAEMAGMTDDPKAWREALDTVAAEALRATELLSAARDAAAALQREQRA